MNVKNIDHINDFNQQIGESSTALLEFRADWCMPCRASLPILEELAKNNPDVPVFAVDVEGDGIEEVLAKYRVRSLPTFIKLKNGNEIGRSVGATPKAVLLELMKGDK